MAEFFLDTNALIEGLDRFSSTPFVIADKTLFELEEIKMSRKADDVKSAARKALRFLNTHKDQYEVVVYNNSIQTMINAVNIPQSPDNIICACAAWYAVNSNPDVKFVTLDSGCGVIASKVFGLDVEEFNNEEAIDYKGFKEITMSDEEMAYFYEHQDQNMYDLLINQYIIIRNLNNEIVDTYRWDGEEYCSIYKKQIKSTYFDKLKPKDIYQSCLVDSIMNNTITATSAPPGAGKSLLSLMCIFNLIENGKYDRVVILYNPSKARGAFDQGYYTGNAVEKGLQQSVGQMLATKFGDQFGVELLIQQGKIKLVSLADCRGMEIRDNEILYMTETQNTTVELIKLALSRVSSGAKVIIEGDYKTQVDSCLFEGNNNGLKRVIKKFKGNSLFGYVELQNIWRSKIAQLAEEL